MRQIRSSCVRPFECELGGDPLKCVGFGSRLSSSAWNLKKPAECPRYLRDHVLEGSGDEFRGIENVNRGPCQVSGANFRHRLPGPIGTGDD